MDLKTAREHAGITQAALAEKCGVSERTILRLESREGYRPSLRTAIRLAAGLGIPVSDLIDEVVS